jgi:hypothetical protein
VTELVFDDAAYLTNLAQEFHRFKVVTICPESDAEDAEIVVKLICQVDFPKISGGKQHIFFSQNIIENTAEAKILDI